MSAAQEAPALRRFWVEVRAPAALHTVNVMAASGKDANDRARALVDGATSLEQGEGFVSDTPDAYMVRVMRAEVDRLTRELAEARAALARVEATIAEMKRFAEEDQAHRDMLASIPA